MREISWYASVSLFRTSSRKRNATSAFAISASAFARNVGALLVYGAVALVLLAIGLLTMGIGLVIALPLIACATWAAWRELCPPEGAEATPSAPA